MTHISYLIETNGENGVEIEWYQLPNEPYGISWIDHVSSFGILEDIPDPSDFGVSEYIRKQTISGYDYYRRSVNIPPKSVTFRIVILTDGSENNGGFTYEYNGSTLLVTASETYLTVVGKSNTSTENNESEIIISSTQYNETVSILVIQEHIPVTLILKSYNSKDVNGEHEGVIDNINFEYTFHWLTSKTSPDNELLTVEIQSTGPKDDFIITDISEYAYNSALDGRYSYHSNTQKYYQTLQTCVNGEFKTVQEEVVFVEDTGGVYKKVKYENDLRVIKEKSTVTIINYGRCFLENDAFYDITISNVNDLSLTNHIIIRYKNESY